MSEYPKSPEAKEAYQKMKIELVDARKSLDQDQVDLLNEYLVKWKLTEKLLKAIEMFQPYCVNSGVMKINLIDGDLGVGEVEREGKVNIALPTEEIMIQQIRKRLGDAYPDATSEDFEDLAYDIVTNVILHESSHKVLLSYPGTGFHEALVVIREVEDNEAVFSSLADEVLVIALQRYFTESNALAGNIAPHTKNAVDEKQKMLYNAADNLQVQLAALENKEIELEAFMVALAMETQTVYDQA